jgi:hypothetical protein
MPIEFSCGSCGKRLRVKDAAAGKRVKCPGCQTVLHVPAATPVSESPAAAPAGTAAPTAAPTPAPAGAESWYVKTDDGQTYGPVPRQELDSWVAEGRLTADSQILREGASQWQWATDEYPQLGQDQPAGSAAGSDNPFDFAALDGGGSGSATAVGRHRGGRRGGGGKLSNKSKIAAGLLGIFLGAYGVHRFYLGYTGVGIIQLCVTVFTCGLGGLWGFIEGIMILTGSFDRDVHGRKLRD